jgi:MFS family permease
MVAELMLMTGFHSFAVLVFALWVFFTGFNLLEATLPSLISKLAPAQSKGSAMGVYSSSQFLGAFLGGTLGGWIHGVYGISGVFALCAAAASLWLIIAHGMTNPRSTGTRLLHVGDIDARQAEALGVRLREVTGVTEAVVVPEDQTAYLKVDTSRIDEATLETLAAPEEED